jgi:hypothetical protein
MKTQYQFYIYGRLREGKFCRMIFLINENDEEIFFKAEVKRNSISQQEEMAHLQSFNFIKDNKLKLIDEFKTSF